ncbi:MAG: SDR family NAD(P)-dependent oxidoreductase [Planctomycetota bacterium]|nr:SDR family NAD(P)-dependent oxidoreductase [Planctomycetota bacterium]
MDNVSGTRPLCLVTGAGRGIGAAIARRVALAGSPVIVAARSQDDCVAVANELVRRGGRAWPAYVDVTDPATLDEALLELSDEIAEHGGIAWLVNNAGIAETAPFLRHGRGGDGDTYEKHLRVNFHGPRRAIERLAPSMLERGHGRIVSVASSAGLIGYPYAAAYVASKHALVGYTRCAALELEGKGVTMNLVAPHYVDSPMTDQTVERIVKKTGRSAADTRAFLAAQNPGGALVTTDEVSAVVLELLNGAQNGVIAEMPGGSAGGKPAVNWRT